MTESEARTLVDVLRELWPSRFYWTPGRIGLWVEKLALDGWTRAQCEAVIRDEATRSDGAKPPMPKILKRCYEAHAKTRPVPAGNQHTPITDAEWAVIHRDREDAQAWWFENKGERRRLVDEAWAAYPMFKAKWDRFMDPEYKPGANACLMLKCACDEYAANGPRLKPQHEPGVVSQVTVTQATAPF